jgi:hypothetical protein
MQKPRTARRPSNTLMALTCAAASLPGMLPPDVHAQAVEDSLRLQTAKYRESDRDLIDTRSGLKPLSVDIISAMGGLSFDNRFRLDFKLTQDIWSGATPVTTAPLAFNGNRAILRNTQSGVIESGASPFVNGSLTLDQQLNPVSSSSQGGLRDSRNVLVMSSASPEVRRQADASIAYEWDEAMLSWGVGTSREDDYLSYSSSVSGRLDFNQKLSSLTLGLNYAGSRIESALDPDLTPYLTKLAYTEQIERKGTFDVLKGRRNDRSMNLGWSQVLNQGALLELNALISVSRGFMENPYKVITAAFYDPSVLQAAGNGFVSADIRALLEQRPDRRQQQAIGGRYIQHIAVLDAALHLNYQHSRDDWGIRSHTLEANLAVPLPAAWMLTPSLRFYSQNRADFYIDYLLSGQAYRQIARDELGREVWESTGNPNVGYSRNPDGSFLDVNGQTVDLADISLRPRYTYFDFGLLPEHFSSDHRLAGFGSFSAGLNISKNFRNGMLFEAGVEHYRRSSAMKAGGGGNSDFADFDSMMATATLTINPRQLAQQQRLNRVTQRVDEHQHHDHALHTGHAHFVPAGVMFAHTLSRKGETMFGYLLEHSKTGDTVYHGNDRVSDIFVVDNGCEPTMPCRKAPVDMVMNMHMLDFGYALSDRMTLMIMTHYMDMNMQLRDLQGRPAPQTGDHEHENLRGHTTGGFSDTTLAGLYRVNSNLHAGLGVNVPTGSVKHEMRRMFRDDGGLMHFDMQTGSGTWDLLPSVTYMSGGNSFSWGMQLAGIYRLEDRNTSGYRLGDELRLTGWSAYTLKPWISLTGRLAHTYRESVAGDYNVFNARLGPMDYPRNTGGSFIDAGLGVRLTIPSGGYSGHSVSMEWLQPIHQSVNGYQLRREGALQTSWHYMF